MKTIEKIHADFDNAEAILKEISQEREAAATALTVPQEDKEHEDGKFLQSIGFNNTTLAKKVKDFNDLSSTVSKQKKRGIEVSNNISETVKIYQDIFPFHKFILYSQVIQICEKYNLCLGPASFFKGEIPQKNIDELKQFPFEKWKEEHTDKMLYFAIEKAICEQPNGTDSKAISNYICAPKNEFDMEGKAMVGREIYDKTRRDSLETTKLPKIERLPKDPIVLLPVKTKIGEPGFIVVTKWGIEADDVGLQVGINN
jgi:hypothetical protein